MKIELSKEMLDFFVRTMQGKKKRLLDFEPSREPERFMSVGGLSIDTGEITKAKRDGSKERREKWELAMNRTERAIDLLS